MALTGGNKGGGRAIGMGGARGVSAKVRLRKAALDDVTFIVADGLFEAGKVIVQRAAAQAPDSPYDPYPTGEGLPKQGGVLAYVGNQKVDGWSIRGPQPVKPKSIRAAAKAHSVLVAIGFGFPGRFAEGGTVKQPAQPFLAPARDAVGPGGVANIVGEVTRPRLASAR
jgi:hypothetical protein